MSNTDRHMRSVRAAVFVARSTSFLLPLIVASAYLNMGQSSCGGGGSYFCQGQQATQVFNEGTHVATEGDDVIVLAVGASQPATVFAGRGNDLVCVISHAANDDITIYGGDGNDTLYGGDAGERLYGEVGDDILYGGRGDDYLDGGDGPDSLSGDDGADTLIGQEHDDLLVGGRGSDSLFGSWGADRLYGSDDDDLLLGGDDNDQLYGEAGNDNLSGGQGNDTLFGGTGADELYGDDGSDNLRGGIGADELFGGTGNDTLWGGGDNDTLWGDENDDTLFGGTGDDWIAGGYGNDILSNGNGDTEGYLNGGPGYDSAYACAVLQSIYNTEEVHYDDPDCPRVRILPLTVFAEELQGGPGHDDDPYFAVIKFSSQFGAQGSTSVEFIEQNVVLGPVGDLLLGLAGSGVVVSGGERETEFPGWIQDELDFGQRSIPADPNGFPVSVDGIILVAMEADDAGWDPLGADGLRDILRERAECLDSSLVSHVETTPWLGSLSFLGALQAVQADLESGCPSGIGTLQGGASLGQTIRGWLKSFASIFVNPDDPMGSAFIVRVSVTDSYFDESIAGPLGNPQDQTCDDGSTETVVAGCAPFLANPCEMKTDPDAITRYASICPALPPDTPIGDRYPREASFPFERATRGKWTVRIGF
ncbi:MAG: hypothetical protein OEQ49_16495 [Myxococcales bacterium]|nr:hypothetical protein [Myxococcales bacterium]